MRGKKSRSMISSELTLRGVTPFALRISLILAKTSGSTWKIATKRKKIREGVVVLEDSRRNNGEAGMK